MRRRRGGCWSAGRRGGGRWSAERRASKAVGGRGGAGGVGGAAGGGAGGADGGRRGGGTAGPRPQPSGRRTPRSAATNSVVPASHAHVASRPCSANSSAPRVAPRMASQPLVRPRSGPGAATRPIGRWRAGGWRAAGVAASRATRAAASRATRAAASRATRQAASRAPQEPHHRPHDRPHHGAHGPPHHGPHDRPHHRLHQQAAIRVAIPPHQQRALMRHTQGADVPPFRDRARRSATPHRMPHAHVAQSLATSSCGQPSLPHAHSRAVWLQGPAVERRQRRNDRASAHANARPRSKSRTHTHPRRSATPHGRRLFSGVATSLCGRPKRARWGRLSPLAVPAAATSSCAPAAPADRVAEGGHIAMWPRDASPRRGCAHA